MAQKRIELLSTHRAHVARPDDNLPIDSVIYDLETLKRFCWFPNLNNQVYDRYDIRHTQDCEWGTSHWS